MSDSTRAVMCVYCGKAIIYKMTKMADTHKPMKDHDRQCQSNPMVKEISALRARVAELKASAVVPDTMIIDDEPMPG
jgi:hypothetical protein